MARFWSASSSTLARNSAVVAASLTSTSSFFVGSITAGALEGPREAAARWRQVAGAPEGAGPDRGILKYRSWRPGLPVRMFYSV